MSNVVSLFKKEPVEWTYMVYPNNDVFRIDSNDLMQELVGSRWFEANPEEAFDDSNYVFLATKVHEVVNYLNKIGREYKSKNLQEACFIPVKEEPVKPVSNFDEIAEKNRLTQEKRKQERSKANTGVLKSYRIK